MKKTFNYLKKKRFLFYLNKIQHSHYADPRIFLGAAVASIFTNN